MKVTYSRGEVESILCGAANASIHGEPPFNRMRLSLVNQEGDTEFVVDHDPARNGVARVSFLGFKLWKKQPRSDS